MRYMLCSIMISMMSLLYSSSMVNAQQTVPVAGLRDNTPRVHALTNVRIIPKPGEAIEQGVVVIRWGSTPWLATPSHPRRASPHWRATAVEVLWKPVATRR